MVKNKIYNGWNKNFESPKVEEKVEEKIEEKIIETNPTDSLPKEPKPIKKPKANTK